MQGYPTRARVHNPGFTPADGGMPGIMKEAAAPTTEQSLSRALDAERVRNVRHLSWVRFLAISAVFGVTLYLGFLRGLADWAIYATPFAAYWTVTALALAGVYRFKWMEHWSGLTLALVDVPAIFWLQTLSMPLSPSPGGVAGFTLGIYRLPHPPLHPLLAPHGDRAGDRGGRHRGGVAPAAGRHRHRCAGGRRGGPGRQRRGRLAPAAAHPRPALGRHARGAQAGPARALLLPRRGRAAPGPGHLEDPPGAARGDAALRRHPGLHLA